MATQTRNSLIQAAIEEHGFSVDSLAGSFFHAYDDGLDHEIDLPSAQGRIVAEPQPGIYVAEMFDSLGTPTHQEIVGLDRIAAQHWHLYDSQDAMQQAYLTMSLEVGA